MTKPTPLAATLALCDAVDQHDKAATPGPLLVEKRDDDCGGIDYPVYAADGDVCICFESDEDAHRARRDAAAYRTLAPALAARLRVVMGVMQAIEPLFDGACMLGLPEHVVRIKDAYRAATAKLEGM